MNVKQKYLVIHSQDQCGTQDQADQAQERHGPLPVHLRWELNVLDQEGSRSNRHGEPEGEVDQCGTQDQADQAQEGEVEGPEGEVEDEQAVVVWVL